MNKDEKLISELLTSYNLVAKNFSKEETRKGKTPDFRVFHDEKCKIHDLINILTGVDLANNGSVLPLFQYYSEGRIRDEKKRIHLFLWVDSIDSKGFLFSDTNESHYHALCNLFGKDPNSIKQIGP